MAGVYLVNHNALVVSTAITIIQIKAGAANPLEIVYAWIGQGLSETSTMEQIQLVRKSGAATVTSFTPLEMNPDGVAAFAVGSTTATGITATAEGTDTDIVVNEAFNILNGWSYLPPPDARPFVPGGGIIGMKFPVAPASATWRAGIVFREL